MGSDAMKDEELLRRYLVGDLGAEEADALEGRLLADGELFELAEAVEGDLLAALARGELSASEREGALRRLAASPQGRARLAMARALSTAADDAGEMSGAPERRPAAVVPFPRRTPSPVSFRMAALAAGLLAVLGGVLLSIPRTVPGPESGAGMIARETPAIPSARPERRLPPAGPAAPAGEIAGRETETPEGERIAAVPPAEPVPEQPVEPEEIAGARPEEPPVQIAQAFPLETAVLRSGGSLPVLDLHGGTERVDFELALDEGEIYSSLTAVVSRTSTGEEIAREESLQPAALDGGPAVIVSVPASKLAEGRYRIELRGISPTGDSQLIGQRAFEVRAAQR